MLSATLIAPELPTASPEDSCGDVLHRMQEHETRQLAVVQEQDYLGLVSKEELNTALTPVELLAQLRYGLPVGNFVYGGQHAYDAASLMSYTGNSIVPVLDEHNHYLGAITRATMVKFFANASAAKEPGGILVLEVARNNYQLREIASIAESDGAKILSMFLAPMEDTGSLHVTIKLSISELGQVVLGFERFGYKVAYAFFDQKQLDDTQQRYDSLLRYLSV